VGGNVVFLNWGISTGIEAEKWLIMPISRLGTIVYPRWRSEIAFLDFFI